MRKFLIGILVLLLLTALVAGGAMAVSIKDRSEAGGPIYTVLEVETGLQLHPSTWVGKTVNVVGTIDVLFCSNGGNPAMRCDISYYLNTMQGEASVASLLLQPQSDPFLGRIRSLPGIGRFLPRPQSLAGIVTLRVKLEPAPTSYFCPIGPCYWGEVSDAGSTPLPTP